MVNIAVNPGFEETTGWWFFTTNPEGYFDYAPDPYSGLYAGRLVCTLHPGTGYIIFGQTVYNEATGIPNRLPFDTPFTFKAKYKNPDAGCTFTIIAKAGNTTVWTLDSGWIPKSATWADVYLDAPSGIPSDLGVTSIALHIQNSGVGTLLVDDVEWLIADPPPPPTYLLNIDSTPISGIVGNMSGTEFVTPFAGYLESGIYTITMPSNVQVEADIYNFIQWTDGEPLPTRNVDLNTDISLSASYELQPTPPLKGVLDVHAAKDGVEIVADVTIVETAQTFQTPFTVEIDPGTYTLKAVSEGETKEMVATVLESQTFRVDFDFTVAPTSIKPLAIIAGVAYFLFRSGG